jgi:DNA topoisomerase I
MSKNLVIVESPAKAKTINKILGNDFIVKASLGHIRDLPQKKLGVDIKNGFQPEYELIAGRKKAIKELQDAAKKVEKIYLAPDPDREGEAIAWHLVHVLSGKERARRSILSGHLQRNHRTGHSARLRESNPD